jgi:hypothetical protein
MNLLFVKEETPLEPIQNVFKLPLSYLPTEVLHQIQSSLAEEFELDAMIHKESTQKPMYEYLFRPSHRFGKDTMALWKNTFTSDVHYLTDQQTILQKWIKMETREKYKVSNIECDDMLTVWNETQLDSGFLETYSYMEFSYFKFLNKSPNFLQFNSILNMTSPVLSFLIPIIMLIIPFLILQIQGIKIDVEQYTRVLSQIAKKHFIGMALNITREFNATNMMYFVGMFVLYAYQMYINYNSCIRFYTKMRELNARLLNLRNYVENSVESTMHFLEISKDCVTYAKFNDELMKHRNQLIKLKELLSSIQPFEPSLSKITQIGYMQRCYYEIHSNRELATSLCWSFGFEGYLDNMRGVYDNIKHKYLNYATFENSNLQIKNQVYSPILYKTEEGEQRQDQQKGEKEGMQLVPIVRNDCTLEKNILITGPNAAGKTTYLKMTLLNVLFSQQIGCGYYTSCTINPYRQIHTYLNIPDTSERDSLFQAESRRCKMILDSVMKNPERQLCVFDELYSGTNPEEATKSSYAFLKFLAKHPNVNFILTTHYVKVCKRLRKNENIKCCKMDAKINKNGELDYTYRMKSGISKIQGAFCVLKSMNYPEEILECMKNF